MGKCVGKFIKIMDAYDEQAGVASVSGTRNKKSFINDLHKMIRQLLGANIFGTSTSHNSLVEAKCHKNFITERLKRMDY